MTDRHPFLIAPRPDGVLVTLGEDQNLKQMSAAELLFLGARAIDAGLEALANGGKSPAVVGNESALLGPVASHSDSTATANCTADRESGSAAVTG